MRANRRKQGGEETKIQRSRSEENRSCDRGKGAEVAAAKITWKAGPATERWEEKNQTLWTGPEVQKASQIPRENSSSIEIGGRRTKNCPWGVREESFGRNRRTGQHNWGDNSWERTAGSKQKDAEVRKCERTKKIKWEEWQRLGLKRGRGGER